MIATAAAASLLLAVVVGGEPWGSLELGLGPYSPNIDSEFQGGATPYRDVFGGTPAPMFRVHVGKAVWSRAGTLEVGLLTGFFSKAGHALQTSGSSAQTADRTALYVVPTSLTLTYRTDHLFERTGVPLAFYARAALQRYNWWVTKKSSWVENGATNGYSGTLGTVLVLDFLDRSSARDLQAEVGVRHTDLYFDVTWGQVNDFGSSKSWDLSARKLFWSGGLMFVF